MCVLTCDKKNNKACYLNSRFKVLGEQEMFSEQHVLIKTACINTRWFNSILSLRPTKCFEHSCSSVKLGQLLQGIFSLLAVKTQTGSVLYLKTAQWVDKS